MHRHSARFPFLKVFFQKRHLPIRNFLFSLFFTSAAPTVSSNYTLLRIFELFLLTCTDPICTTRTKTRWSIVLVDDFGLGVSSSVDSSLNFLIYVDSIKTWKVFKFWRGTRLAVSDFRPENQSLHNYILCQLLNFSIFPVPSFWINNSPESICE